ncbi:hypothetical protein [Pusillimonas sp.]|uniref:hypothetical protein n=1 Tax=Pusillimonas sp. TaxID=3040095 RepID=UPI0029AB1DE4|nr:hypothetical protein [Pusillimonas sp.]MDX3894239.1 hypothetical protein [Pusillimonas sp.]
MALSRTTFFFTTRIPTMFRTFLLSCILPLSLLPAAAQSQEVLFYNIAHAINHSQYIDWAVSQGANAVEADLRFTSGGAVDKFQHGMVCECVASKSDLCTQMLSVNTRYQPNPRISKIERVFWPWDACMVNEEADSFMQTLARKSSIALFIVDSKVGGSVAKDDRSKASAGRSVIWALEEHLFAKGYGGKVIVGVDEDKHQAYTRSAMEVAARSKYADRIYFSFDENGKSSDKARATVELLKTIAPGKAVYGNGVSATLIGNFHDAFKVGVAAEKEKTVNLNYIWTLDKATSMMEYIGIGVRGIMTNNPGTLRSVLKAFPHMRLARPDDPLL